MLNDWWNSQRRFHGRRKLVGLRVDEPNRWDIVQR
jgi:hypothetical protein